MDLNQKVGRVNKAVPIKTDSNPKLRTFIQKNLT